MNINHQIVRPAPVRPVLSCSCVCSIRRYFSDRSSNVCSRSRHFSLLPVRSKAQGLQYCMYWVYFLSGIFVKVERCERLLYAYCTHGQAYRRPNQTALCIVLFSFHLKVWNWRSGINTQSKRQRKTKTAILRPTFKYLDTTNASGPTLYVHVHLMRLDE